MENRDMDGVRWYSFLRKKRIETNTGLLISDLGIERIGHGEAIGGDQLRVFIYQ